MAAQGDAELVAESLAGNREAFGHIVARYQSLICSIAYSATGSLTQSEDLAQDTFIAAWKQLKNLREPASLRSWLCGIARNLCHTQLRKQGREPVHQAESLDSAQNSPGQEPLPAEQAISREEEAILWRSLEQIPELYREPLILYYREQQSVERVAEALELTVDNAKQRLSRGRKMLQEQVAGLVEGALARTSPGKVFTLAVLTALPVTTASASAATLGATAVKGTGAAHAAASFGWLGAILGPLLGILGGYLGYRMSLESARSEAERAFIKHFSRILLGAIFGFFFLLAPLVFWSRSLVRFHPHLYIGLLIGLSLAYTGCILWLSFWARGRLRHLTAQAEKEGTLEPPRRPQLWGVASREYRSRLSLLGWPLVHVRLGGPLGERRRPAKGWLAIGDSAVGLLLAFGGIAVAPISLGGLSIGLLSLGGCALGLLGIGGFALGLWSIGGCAVGWLAFGGSATAWKAALGGVAIAKEIALGGAAYGPHANDSVASAFIRDSRFFQTAQASMRYAVWLNLLWLLPLLACWWSLISKRRRS